MTSVCTKIPTLGNGIQIGPTHHILESIAYLQTSAKYEAKLTERF
jgi:hypothetical protein